MNIISTTNVKRLTVSDEALIEYRKRELKGKKKRKSDLEKAHDACQKAYGILTKTN